MEIRAAQRTFEGKPSSLIREPSWRPNTSLTLDRRIHTNSIGPIFIRLGGSQDLHKRILQHRRLVRSLRSWCAVHLSLPAAAGQQAILFGGRRGWAAPKEIPDVGECGDGTDGVEHWSVYIFASVDIQIEVLIL